MNFNLKEFKNDWETFKSHYSKLLKKENFHEFKLPSGETLTYDGDTPQMGMDIFILNGKEKLPAPDGDYQTEDGTVISVQAGKITNVKMPEAPITQDAAPQAPKPEAKQPVMVTKITETKFNEIEKKHEDFSKKFDEFLKNINEFIDNSKKENENFQKKFAEQEKFSKEIISVIDKIADSPSSTNNSKPKDIFKKKEKSDFEKNIEDFRNKYILNINN